MMNDAPTVLVTGADGLLGRHVVRALIDSGACRVVAVSRRPTQPAVDRLGWVKADLRQTSDVQALVGASADVIVHTAAALPKTLDDDMAANANRVMDANVLSLANTVGAGLIYTSSLSVYEGCAVPWSESLPVRPVSAYAAGKYEAEMAIKDRTPPWAALRIASPYSASDTERQGVLYHFAREAVAGRQLMVTGEGRRAQDFVHAADVACAVATLVRHWRTDPLQAASGTFNIASGHPVSMSELAELVVSCCGSGEIVCRGVEAEPDYKADMVITQAAQVLRWRPQVALRTGLEQLIRHLRGAHEDWLAI